MAVARTLLAVIALGALGCSLEPQASPKPDTEKAPSADDASEAASTSAAPPPAPVCNAAETTRLQAALDGAHAASTDAVLAVKTECGIRFFASGPSRYGAKVLHRIGSVTKTYVAGVVLLLASEGKLALDATLASFGPSFGAVPNASAITIRHLLQHRSGVFAYTDDDDFVAQMSPTRRFTPTELVSFATRHPAKFAPGTAWEYSNTNTILLALIAEKLAGAPIASLIRKRILEPLGLAETFLSSDESFAPFTLARGRDANGTDVTDIADPSWAWAAGAMVATPSDVAKWIAHAATGSLYAPNVTKAMQASLLELSNTGTTGLSCGLGLFRYAPEVSAGAGPEIGHDGGLAGFNTQAWHLPDRAATVVAIADSDLEDANFAFAAAVEASDR
jgi:D-alanyl-D-alanine carboxypeptidase